VKSKCLSASSYGFLSATNRVCKALCLIEELALCLDLILGKVDLGLSAQITCLVRSLALWLSAQEKMNVRD
jgi:hypothetical protein